MKFATSVLWIIIYLTLHFGAWPATLETCSLCFTAADFSQLGCSCWKSLVSRNLAGDGAVSALGVEVTPCPGLSELWLSELQDLSPALFLSVSLKDVQIELFLSHEADPIWIFPSSV